MCVGWKKLYLCGCISAPHIDRCQEAFVTGQVCEDEIEEEHGRKSYFQCYDCIKAEVWREKEEAVRAEGMKRLEKKKSEEKARSEKIRRDAQERAKREREEDERRKELERVQEEKDRQAGGRWVAAGGNKKGKGRKGGLGVGGGGPVLNPSLPSNTATGAFGWHLPSKSIMGGRSSENMTPSTPGKGAVGGIPGVLPISAVGIAVAGLAGSPAKGDGPGSPAPLGVDPGGRAGRWGPSGPSGANGANGGRRKP
ncbi:hypothetical protein BCR34DRAFT_568225 [Clohesyomyces aquaticus]|uniref:Uncharacterized protein n=1 Tax=Clohesyomyces aquaticus TaxID=1231657 RepID=A0A1Y1ZH85_9PLEO|nr:hypothetical protein BCR34DRAFT_568225 [Clohesyomyces aquaticus]